MQPDPANLKLRREIGRSEILLSVARLPGEERLLLGSSEAKLYELDLSQEKPEPRALEEKGHSSYVTGVAVADGCVVSGGWEGRLVWRDGQSLEITRSVEAHQKWIRDVVASPDGRLVASVGDDMVCRVWQAADGKLLHELRGHEPITPHHYPSMLYACTFSPGGEYLATADKVGHVVVWDTSTGQSLATLEVPEMYTWDPRQRRHSIGGVRSLAFSPYGRLLAIGGMGQVGNIDHLEGKARVEVYDWRAGERTHEFPGDQFKGLVTSLHFHHDDQWLVAGGGDNAGFLMFFDLAKNEVIKQEKAPMHIHRLTLSPASDAVYAAGHHRFVVWDLES